jgi:hypothetical protein
MTSNTVNPFATPAATPSARRHSLSSVDGNDARAAAAANAAQTNHVRTALENHAPNPLDNDSSAASPVSSVQERILRDCYDRLSSYHRKLDLASSIPDNPARVALLKRQIEQENENIRSITQFMLMSAGGPPSSPPVNAPRETPRDAPRELRFRIPPNLPAFRQPGVKGNIEDIEIFLQQFLSIMTAHRVPVDAWFDCINLCVSFSDAEWHESIALPDKSWESIRIGFLYYFEDTMAIVTRWKEFILIHQQESKSVNHYTARFCRLARLLHEFDGQSFAASIIYWLGLLPAISNRMNQTLHVKLIEGGSDKYAAIRTTITVDTLHNSALLMEALMGNLQSRKDKSPSTPAPSSTPSPTTARSGGTSSGSRPKYKSADTVFPPKKDNDTKDFCQFHNDILKIRARHSDANCRDTRNPRSNAYNPATAASNPAKPPTVSFIDTKTKTGGAFRQNSTAIAGLPENFDDKARAVDALVWSDLSSISDDELNALFTEDYAYLSPNAGTN